MTKGETHPDGEDVKTVFFSWQSDLDVKLYRNAIRAALKKACKDIKVKHPSLKFEVDEATKRVAGSPNIAEKILEKIDQADIFVADVSTINGASSDKKCPNPNVTFELGYAVRVLGWDRIILLFNKDCGDLSKNLPFDFSQNRVSVYSIDNGDLSPLTSLMKQAISAIGLQNPKRPSEIRGLSKRERLHQRDLEMFSWIMSTFNIACLDSMIESLPHSLEYEALFYFDGFSDVYQSSLFHINDPEMAQAFAQMYHSWQTCVSNSNSYDEASNPNLYIFTNRMDAPLSADKQNVWDEIDAARRQLNTTLQEILFRLRRDFVEIDFLETSRVAREDYLAVK